MNGKTYVLSADSCLSLSFLELHQIAEPLYMNQLVTPMTYIPDQEEKENGQDQVYIPFKAAPLATAGLVRPYPIIVGLSQSSLYEALMDDSYFSISD